MNQALHDMSIILGGTLASGQHKTFEPAVEEAIAAYSLLEEFTNEIPDEEYEPSTAEIPAEAIEMARRFIGANSIAAGQQIQAEIRSTFDTIEATMPTQVVAFARRIMNLNSEEAGRRLQGEIRTWLDQVA